MNLNFLYFLHFEPSEKQTAFYNDERKYTFFNTKGSNMITDERKLYPSIIDAGKEKGWALYRIEDAGANKKPFDIGGCSPDGKGVAIEVKLVRKNEITNNDYKIVPLSLFSTHQLNWLLKFAKLEAISLILIYYANQEKYLVFNYVNGNWKYHISINNTFEELKAFF